MTGERQSNTRTGNGRGQPRPAGVPGPLGRTGGFRVRLGARIAHASVRGYYVDFTIKAEDPHWPPPWFGMAAHRMHVVPIQWALGSYERFLATGDESWLAGARGAGDWLCEEQQRGGRQDGGWIKDFPYKHTYRVAPPWVSGMAQGQGASLLVRLHLTTGDERYADAALRALNPMREPVAAGGVGAELDGGFFPEEYPTDPPSHVLNGGIFGLWGCRDVALALSDPGASELDTQGTESLARSLPRYDTGRWSRYDLYPHPVVNVAHITYHRLHIVQLRAMAAITADPRFERTAARFEQYAASRARRADAFARKALFRVAVPRNQRLARALPWTREAAS